jgi:hypothetical protein
MMVWLNEYDIDMLVDRFEDQTAAPHVVKGVLALDRFRDWTNRNSDGWAYWKLPAKAADKLMDRLEEAQRQYRRGGLCEDMTPQQLAALLRPVRALMRKHGVEDTDAILFPPPPPAPVSYAPCITGKIEIGGRVSEFMIPLDPESSTQYSQWGADNTVLWPRTDLLEKMHEVAREWVLDNPEEGE